MWREGAGVWVGYCVVEGFALCSELKCIFWKLIKLNQRNAQWEVNDGWLHGIIVEQACKHLLVYTYTRTMYSLTINC